MNLLQDPWIPVRDDDGQRAWITPDRLSEPQWRAFDADRPDFNGALAQFAIGLLQTTAPVDDLITWRGLFRQAPDAATLRQWFAPVAAAFELDGDGARLMQDLNLGQEGVAVNGVGALLVDAPGDATVKNNADHFVKRQQVACLCPACAATALFTLQTNAPAGGAGHRTGLRGGGPLSTLVLAAEGATLWQDLWVNVMDRNSFLAQRGDARIDTPQHTFPWLVPIDQLQAPKGETSMGQVHPAQHFWAMPRRIRLQFEPARPADVQHCDVCGRSATHWVRHYGTRNYGLNYKGEWNHPLSPYYRDQAKEGWLPLHPQPDGLGYRHWLAWVLGVAGERRTTRVAPVVSRALEQLRRQTGPTLRLWAFGYDMDNMKARCWYESTLPLYGLADCDADAASLVQAEVERWLAAAELTGQMLRSAVKDAWFGHEARGDFAHVDAAFWGDTAPVFYGQLQALIDAVRAGDEPAPLPTREAWHGTLVKTARRLFDLVFVGTGVVERQNPRRVALAWQHLNRNLQGRKLKLALGLPVAEPESKPARGKGGARISTTQKEPA
jgi:CRISPR system Cascade subunit CasA